MLIVGTGAVGYDTLFMLAWGGDLAAGRDPFVESAYSPTPHPLAIGFGALLAPLGDEATLTVVGVASWCALGAAAVAVFHLARAVFDSRVAAAVAVTLVVTRPSVIESAAASFVDIPFAALVLSAAAVEAVSPRERPGTILTLLTLAGLLRPEAWGLGVLYVACRARHLWPLALVAPLAWAVSDLLLTGDDPLHSLTSTHSTAERIDRPRGLGTAIELAPAYLQDLAGTPTFVAALAGALLVAADRSRRALLVLALFVAGLAAFLAVGIAGLSVLDRYLLLPAMVLCVLAARALSAWRPVAAAVATVAIVALSLPALADVRSDAVEDHVGQRDALDALRTYDVGTCSSLSAGNRTIPLIVYVTRRHPDSIVLARVEDGLFALGECSPSLLPLGG